MTFLLRHQKHQLSDGVQDYHGLSTLCLKAGYATTVSDKAIHFGIISWRGCTMEDLDRVYGGVFGVL